MKRENPQLKQIEGLVKDLLEREGLTAEGGPWGAGWIQSCWKGLLPEVEGLGTSAGDPGGRGPALELPPGLSSHCPPHSFSGKIEIKIVRPGTEGTEEDARWLTDEDTKNLKEIFFNILVRGTPPLSPGLPAFPVPQQAEGLRVRFRVLQAAPSLASIQASVSSSVRRGYPFWVLSPQQEPYKSPV